MLCYAMLCYGMLCMLCMLCYAMVGDNADDALELDFELTLTKHDD
jgi:hypothetical protein